MTINTESFMQFVTCASMMIGVAAFIVYLVATGGWERVTEMWNRTKVLSK